MKLSVSAWCIQKSLFGKKTGLKEFIDFCRKNGADAVELLDCFWENEAHVEEIKTYLDAIGMPVSSYSIGNDFVQPMENDRQLQVEYVKKGVDTAVRLGTKILRVFSGSGKDGVSYDEGKEWIINCFKECAKYAEDKGIALVLENHGQFAGKSSQVKNIITSVGSPALRANTDTGNFLLVDENPLAAVKCLEGRIGFVHFKDFTKVDNDGEYMSTDGKQYSGTVIGSGDVPLKEIIDFLAESGYEGYLSIEYEGSGDPFEGTLMSIEFTKNNMK